MVARHRPALVDGHDRLPLPLRVRPLEAQKVDPGVAAAAASSSSSAPAAVPGEMNVDAVDAAKLAGPARVLDPAHLGRAAAGDLKLLRGLGRRQRVKVEVVAVDKEAHARRRGGGLSSSSCLSTAAAHDGERRDLDQPVERDVDQQLRRVVVVRDERRAGRRRPLAPRPKQLRGVRRGRGVQGAQPRRGDVLVQGPGRAAVLRLAVVVVRAAGGVDRHDLIEESERDRDRESEIDPGGFRFFPCLCAPPSLEEPPTHLRIRCRAKQHDSGEKRYRCCDAASHGRAWG